MITLRDKLWEQAQCKDEDINIFFPEQGTTYKENIKLAKSMCAACPIAEQCLEFAISNEMADGVWGGKTASERKSLRRTKKYRSIPLVSKNK